MNTKLLRRVAKHISEEPRRLNMDITLNTIDTYRAERYVKEMPPCGTVGCIAGWTCVLSESVPKYFDEVIPIASSKLGLTHEQADALFAEPKFNSGDVDYARVWPRRFAKRYLKAKTPKGRASATVARIEHFIKTKGAE